MTNIMNQQSEKKELEIDKDYGFVFGLDAESKQHMIYLGCDKWRGVQGEQEMEIVCEKTSIKVNNYINPNHQL